jgi:3-oxoacyl-[acyl-carrier protein] reductase
MNLQNKHIVITGAAQGMGQAAVAACISQGATVTGCDLNTAGLAQMTEQFGEAFTGVSCDISDSQAVANMMQEAKAQRGRIDGLVNNAGVGSLDEFIDTPDEHWAKVIGVNLTGAFYCAREASKIMVEQGAGAVINISSTAAYTGEGPSHYCAAKAGLIGLTRSMAKELASHNIRVNAVIPGPTNTPMMADIPEDWMEQMIAGIPLGRMGEPTDIANMLVFLLSDAAGFCTGQNFTVNGGMAFI